MPSPDEMKRLPDDNSSRRTFPPDLHGGTLQELLRVDILRSATMIREVLLAAETRELDEASQASREFHLVGRIQDTSVRRTLLMWSLGYCFEMLRNFETAASLFARCLSLDVGNPVHAYNRGACLLRLGSWRAACNDFDLAVSLCLARGVSPPLVLLCCRALAGTGLPDRKAEVWADFELTRQRLECPGLPVRSIQIKLAQSGVGSYEDYRQRIEAPSLPGTEHRHWAAFILARTHGEPEKAEEVSEAELNSLAGLLRRLPGLTALSLETLRARLFELSTHFVPAGQPLLPASLWYCILDGSFDIVRFAACKELSTAESDSAALGLPAAMMQPPSPEVAGKLGAMDTFRGTDPQGPAKDGWLLATGYGATLLSVPFSTLRWLHRRCANQTSSIGESNLERLTSAPLLRHCDAGALRAAAADSLFEKHEAICGESITDLCGPGLCIILAGELRLLSSPGDCEVCMLGPGDFMGEAALLGGEPALCFERAEVVSAHLEVVVLPAGRQREAEELGLLNSLAKGREAASTEMRARAASAATWARARSQLVAEARSSMASTKTRHVS